MSEIDKLLFDIRALQHDVLQRASGETSLVSRTVALMERLAIEVRRQALRSGDHLPDIPSGPSGREE